MHHKFFPAEAENSSYGKYTKNVTQAQRKLTRDMMYDFTAQPCISLPSTKGCSICSVCEGIHYLCVQENLHFLSLTINVFRQA